MTAPRSLTIALAQLNPVLGDVDGNAAKALAAWKQAGERGADAGDLRAVQRGAEGDDAAGHRGAVVAVHPEAGDHAAGRVAHDVDALGAGPLERAARQLAAELGGTADDEP